MMTSFTGFSIILSNTAYAAPAFSSCSFTLSSEPLILVDFPLEIRSIAFLPGSVCSESAFSFPLPNTMRVGL